MPNQLTLLPTPGTLAIGTCYPDEQARLNDFASKLPITFPATFTGLVTSSTKPADTTQVWQQLDTLGRPVRIYQFASGSWLSLHTLVPGMTMIWTTALPDFTSFDGGDANPVSDTSGPMWELVTALNAKFPLGAGTLPAGAVVPIGGTGGEDLHVLSTAELALHTHNTGLIHTNLADGSGTTPTLVTTGLVGATQTPTDNGGPNGINGNGHNTMPPYLGVSFLRRTARLFYSVN